MNKNKSVEEKTLPKNLYVLIQSMEELYYHQGVIFEIKLPNIKRYYC